MRLIYSLNIVKLRCWLMILDAGKSEICVDLCVWNSKVARLCVGARVAPQTVNRANKTCPFKQLFNMRKCKRNVKILRHICDKLWASVVCCWRAPADQGATKMHGRPLWVVWQYAKGRQPHTPTTTLSRYREIWKRRAANNGSIRRVARVCGPRRRA